MVQLRSIYGPIKRDLRAVESILSEVARDLDAPLALEVRKALSARGKRLRPGLLILSCRTAGSNADVSQAAAAMELVHSAALLHDDVVDHALTRRGVRTASAELGRGVTVVLGNYLYSKAFRLMPNSDGVRHQFSAATTTMCSGEALELSRRGDVGISIGEYMQATGKKTASLISACCAIGARLGGGDARTVNSLAMYGLLLGFAFQIRDDCIDLTGGEKVTGKGCCKDLEERNATLPLILALSRMEGDEKERVASMFEGRTFMDTGWLADAVERHAGIAESMTLASEYADRAAKCLTSLKNSAAKESLSLLTTYSVERDA